MFSSTNLGRWLRSSNEHHFDVRLCWFFACTYHLCKKCKPWTEDHLSEIMRQGCAATLYLRKNMSLIFGLLSNAYHQTQDIVDIRTLIAFKKLHLTQPPSLATRQSQRYPSPTNCVSLYIQNIQKPQRDLNLQDESGVLRHRTYIYIYQKKNW